MLPSSLGDAAASPADRVRDPSVRIEEVAQGADLGAVAQALVRRRDEILAGWLAAARDQPFHRDHPDRAVADHIPTLFDAVVALLVRTSPPDVPVKSPIDDEAVTRAARAHAQVRFEQRLGPVAIATEFRLLRQEVSRALRQQLDDSVPAGEVIAAIALVNDALDGATTLALATLLERVETVREEFLASTLHDVRQPMTMIEASLALASRWARRPRLDRARLIETLDGGLYAAQEMNLIVDTLADASRVAMGAVELDLEPVRVGEVVRDALELIEPQTRDRIQVGPLAPETFGDWDRHAVRRILTNLITNALKYSPRDRGIRICATRIGSIVAIDVIDEGIGLLPEELAVLFRRYGRTEDARARGLPGLGLGLYASQGLAVAHGGRVVLTSEGRDRGTRARLELPIQESDGA